MNEETLKVEEVHTQYTVPNVISHGVRFDVLATSNGKIYDIEVQRDDNGAIPRRARYNSSMLDVNSLRSGKKYIELPVSYVIFITEHDVLHRQKPIYHINRKIEETGENFNDGSHIIYVNAENRDDTALGRLMQDFFCSIPDSLNYKILANRVKYLKETKEGIDIMSPIIEEIYNKGLQEGRKELQTEIYNKGIEEGRQVGMQEGRQVGMQEGRQELQTEFIITMLRKKYSFDIISDITKISVEKIEEIGRNNKLI